MRTGDLVAAAVLARRRLRSPTDYRAFQRKLASMSVQDLRRRSVDLSALRVLELAAGPGGYSDVLAEESRSFVTSDIERHPELSSAHEFTTIDATRRFPLDDGTFDFVYCSSLIEHIDAPENLLSECLRVLAPGGRMLLSFPPFWSLFLVGGHEYKPWHLLGRRASLRVHRLRRGGDDHHYNVEGRGVFPRRIDEVDRLITASGFRIEATWVRFLPFDFERIPGVFADLLTWHACWLLERPEGRA